MKLSACSWIIQGGGKRRADGDGTDDAAETHQQPRKGPCWGVLRVVGEGGLIH